MQVILQSETIQELTKTSQTLASLQQEASVLRKLADAHRSENVYFLFCTDFVLHFFIILVLRASLLGFIIIIIHLFIF